MSSVKSEDVLRVLWKLRTNPLDPRIGPDDKPLRLDAVRSALDPSIDSRAARYYFDVYDWSGSRFIRGISENGTFKEFTDRRRLPTDAALMVLVSGYSQTGRDSLVNLVLHEVRRSSERAPFIIELQLEGRDASDHLRAIAAQFVFELNHPVDKMDDGAERRSVAANAQHYLEDIAKAQESGFGPSYVNVFRNLRQLVEPLGQEIAIRILDGGDHDSWVRVYDAVRLFCSYLIVTTANLLSATTCHDLMTAANKNVCWIRATRMGVDKAVRYLTRRISAERLEIANEIDQYLPFSRDAIDTLYLPGTTARADDVVEHPIGWLRWTLRRALEDLMAEILKEVADDANVLAQMDGTTRLVDSARIQKVRDMLNRGHK